MSNHGDDKPGPGWWVGKDGRWRPPDDAHPTAGGKEEKSKEPSRRRPFIVGALALLLLAGIAVGLGVGLSKPKSPPDVPLKATAQAHAAPKAAIITTQTATTTTTTTTAPATKTTTLPPSTTTTTTTTAPIVTTAPGKHETALPATGALLQALRTYLNSYFTQHGAARTGTSYSFTYSPDSQNSVWVYYHNASPGTQTANGFAHTIDGTWEVVTFTGTVGGGCVSNTPPELNPAIPATVLSFFGITIADCRGL